MLLSVVLGVALVLRLGALLLTADVSASANLWEYGEQGACALRHGGDLCLYYPDGQSYPSAYMPPLLSYGWLGLFEVFGDGSVARVAWLVANLAAGLGSVALLFQLSMALWPSRWAAFAASGIMAVYPTFVFVTATYHQTNWAVLLLLAIALVAVKLSDGTRPWLYGALGGVLCGLAALNRTEMLVIGPVLIAIGAAWRRNLKTLVKAGLAGGIVMVLILAPWVARNYQEFGRVIPTAQSTGYNMWKGFTPYTNGSGNLSEDPNGPAAPERARIRASVPPGPGYETRLQDAYMEVFEADVRTASVERLAGLTATKVVLLWAFDWTDRDLTGSLAYRLPWMVVNFFAAVGFVVAWRKRSHLRAAPAVIYATAVVLLTAAYAVTSVHARYRMHIEPFLFVLAGIGVEALWLRLRAARRQAPAPQPAEDEVSAARDG